jgi:hypothetical protein
MLKKQVTIDKIEVVENDIIQVRQATAILEDDIEFSKTYHRWTLTKGDDITEQDAKVQAVCNAVWGLE